MSLNNINNVQVYKPLTKSSLLAFAEQHAALQSKAYENRMLEMDRTQFELMYFTAAHNLTVFLFEHL